MSARRLLPAAHRLIEEGDTIEINIPEASIHLAVSDEELARRKAAYVQPEPNVKSGWLARYARMVLPPTWAQ